MLRGWAISERGRGQEGARLIREGISQYIGAGTRIGLGFFFALLAEAEAKSNAFDEALVTLEDALTSTAEEAWTQPYLLWVRGNVLLSKAGSTWQQQDTLDLETSQLVDQAEQSFRQSIDLSVRIEGKSVQLRAATSLARILKSRGLLAEAKEMLKSIYSSFSEGFDTKDLTEVRALLEELS
jgi:predicted ATPase